MRRLPNLNTYTTPDIVPVIGCEALLGIVKIGSLWVAGWVPKITGASYAVVANAAAQ